MKKLSWKDQLLVGLTLFSMFFGAGNLIFPPFLGAQAGTAVWVVMAGFAVSAIGLPVLGVVAVARCDGLPSLAGRVHPGFARIFILLCYLSIGPCLAIPRTAVTSFEMAVLPFAGESASGWALPLYSVVFFGAALLLALRPEKLTDRLGKVLAPCLLLLILAVFLGCILNSPGGYGSPARAYAGLAKGVSQGVLDGYQTMDAIAALVYGIVIALNIREKGLSQGKDVVRATVLAGGVAGVILLAVYAALAHIGALSGAAFPGAANGAQVLTAIVAWLFGGAGSVVLALIFTIACFNTCVSLISSCGKYFNEIFPRWSYRRWALVFAGVSGLISVAGLDAILKVSAPVLEMLYPPAIVLIFLGLSHTWADRFPWVWPWAVAWAAAVSIPSVLDRSLKLTVPVVTPLLKGLPLYSLGLAWILPALLGGLAGAALWALLRGRKTGTA